MKEKISVWFGIGILLALGVAVTLREISLLNADHEAQTVSVAVQPSASPVSTDLTPLRGELCEMLRGREGLWSVYVGDLRDGASLVINDLPVAPASVIKLFRMIAFYDALRRGEVTLGEEERELLREMITVSDNEASNRVVELIGGGDFETGAQRVTDTARALGCNQTQDGMRLYDYEPWFPVPGENRTSVEDCGRVLTKLYQKSCISPEYDEEMIQLLLAQTRRQKLPAGLPPDARIANKTGETDDIQADVGIVFGEKRDFVICVIGTQLTESIQSVELIASLAQKTYSYLN